MNVNSSLRWCMRSTLSTQQPERVHDYQGDLVLDGSPGKNEPHHMWPSPRIIMSLTTTTTTATTAIALLHQNRYEFKEVSVRNFHPRNVPTWVQNVFVGSPAQRGGSSNGEDHHWHFHTNKLEERKWSSETSTVLTMFHVSVRIQMHPGIYV